MRYRTKDGNDYTVGDIGRTVNGIIVTDRVIENPNFEIVEETTSAAPAPTQPIASPSRRMLYADGISLPFTNCRILLFTNVRLKLVRHEKLFRWKLTVLTENSNPWFFILPMF